MLPRALDYGLSEAVLEIYYKYLETLGENTWFKESATEMHQMSRKSPEVIDTSSV